MSATASPFGVMPVSHPSGTIRQSVLTNGIASAYAEDRDRSAPAAGRLLPAVHGLQVGVVTSNVDPDGEHRVRVRHVGSVDTRSSPTACASVIETLESPNAKTT